MGVFDAPPSPLSWGVPHHLHGVIHCPVCGIVSEPRVIGKATRQSGVMGCILLLELDVSAKASGQTLETIPSKVEPHGRSGSWAGVEGGGDPGAQYILPRRLWGNSKD